jgi:predicted dienelactone hydrolase
MFPLRRVLTGMGLLLLGAAAVSAPASVDPGAPALARLGPHAVGVIEKHLIERGQVDPLASIAAHQLVKTDRPLRLLIWYPAKPGGQPTPYTASLTAEPPLPPKSFHIPALAVTNAAPLGAQHPVVIISHGFSNDPAMMSWIGENLATKGYVVVAIGHSDPPYTDRTRAVESIVLRPLDIAFVAQELRSGLLGTLADPTRLALIGYSMGGYGVLAAGGARLDPTQAPFQALPAHVLDAYQQDNRQASGSTVAGIKAIIAIAPGGRTPFSAWGKGGLTDIRAPLLVVVGDHDRSVGFDPGPAAIFAEAVNSSRTLLVFKGAGHSIGVDPLPAEMRGNAWNQAWFEDPVWRKERITATSLHFITAFLDLHVKGDASRADYLTVSSADSDDAPWSGPDTPFDAVSQGGANTAWKGFVRNQQVGLILRHLEPTP